MTWRRSSRLSAASVAPQSQELVRECVREKFGQKDAIDKAAIARRLAGVWKDRSDLGNTGRFVRRLRKDSRRRRLGLG